MEFGSVDDFLRKVTSAKKVERDVIDEGLGDMLDNPAVFGIPPELAKTLEGMLEEYGDEALRQVGMFCLGKWMHIHNETIQAHIQTEGWQEALLTMNDVSKLSTALRIIEEVGSFGGGEQWTKMLKQLVGQAVMENCEERGIDIFSFFKNND
jgi:uncharacterized protein YjeT (DUF2065 family)